MSETSGKSGKNKQPISLQIQKFVIGRKRKSVADWRAALQSAENPNNPRRERLQTIYKDCLLNAHLMSVINKRITAVTNANIKFLIDGKEDKALSAHFSESWFTEMVKEIINTKFWGHSLLEFVVTDGRIENTLLINRFHVSPETGFIYLEKGNEKTKLNFKEPPISNIVLEVGEPYDLGLLNKAVPYCLYLKDCYGDWATYNEMFGMPYRIAKYDPQFGDQRTELESFFKDAGSASWAVIPQGSDMDLHFANGTGSAHTYEHFIKSCNSELSKLIVGQTMTTEDGASKSQAQVHQEVEAQINAADMLFVENVLNDRFKSLLLYFGYPVEKGEFQFDRTEQLKIADRLKLDVQLNSIIEIPPEYFYETYNIPVPQEGAALKQKAEPKPEISDKKKVKPDAETSDNKKDLKWQNLQNFYGLTDLELADRKKNILGDIRKHLKIITDTLFKGESFKNGVYAPLIILVSDKLFEAITKGWKAGKGDYDYQTPDTEFLKQLKSNTYRFSAAKNKSMLQLMNAALLDDKGGRRSFNDFKAAVTQINEAFNVNWLRTEYNYATAAARMTAGWLRIQEQKEDFPYLRYETVGDERVRSSHQSLDGLTLKVDDTFWDSFYPPNDWGCRCDVTPLTQEEAKGFISPKAKIDTATKNYQPKALFKNNAAKTGEIFSKDHPYFKD